MAYTFYHMNGVFSPRGALEAVEESEEMAKAAAVNLSPLHGNTRVVNRTVEPVIVFRGSYTDLLRAFRMTEEPPKSNVQPRAEKADG